MGYAKFRELILEFQRGKCGSGICKLLPSFFAGSLLVFTISNSSHKDIFFLPLFHIQMHKILAGQALIRSTFFHYIHKRLNAVIFPALQLHDLSSREAQVLSQVATQPKRTTQSPTPWFTLSYCPFFLNSLCTLRNSFQQRSPFLRRGGWGDS